MMIETVLILMIFLSYTIADKLILTGLKRCQQDKSTEDIERL